MHGTNPKEGIFKKYEQRIADDVREKYHVVCNQIGFQVDTISDLGTHVGTFFLAWKLMCKFLALAVPVYVIQLAVRYEKGFYFN